MIPFSRILHLLKLSVQLLDGPSFCFKCFANFRSRYNASFYEDKIISLQEKKLYKDLPSDLRLHIESCLSINYLLIFFLEESLHDILETPAQIPAKVDFLKEFKNSLTIPKLSKSEKELTETLVELLLEIRSAKVIPSHEIFKNVSLEMLQLQQNSYK